MKCGIQRGKIRQMTVQEAREAHSDPESIRLVNIVRKAQLLACDIAAFRRDHPESCKCRTCRYLAFRQYSHPTITDYLVALHAIIASASAAHEDLPGDPRPPVVATGKAGE